jgi:hypothetical protein
MSSLLPKTMRMSPSLTVYRAVGLMIAFSGSNFPTAMTFKFYLPNNSSSPRLLPMKLSGGATSVMEYSGEKGK